LVGLLELNDVRSDLPVGGQELSIDGLLSAKSTVVVDLGNSADEALVAGTGLEFRGHGGESEKEECACGAVARSG
jgi:hypothetical protein